MCTAFDVSQQPASGFLNCAAAAAAAPSSGRPSSSSSGRNIVPGVVRFAMKPRHSSTAAEALLRGREPEEHHRLYQQHHHHHLNQAHQAFHQVSTPRTSNGLAGVRRVQSANASSSSASASMGRRSRSVIAAAGPARECMHKSRSHSHGPAVHHAHSSSSSYVQQRYLPVHQPSRTQELPIPASSGAGSRHGADGLARSVDKTDLARMYDYATWNMYERIVNARRRRLSELDRQGAGSEEASSSSSESSPSSGSSNFKQYAPAKKAASSAARQQRQQNQPALSKTSSHDDANTLATADETDKSSTTSSSWSRTDSPGTFPAASGNVVFPNFDHARSMSCPPPVDHMGLDDDEHFIFELDM